MSKINETPVWEPEIYKLTTETPVLGFDDDANTDGPSNIQAMQLANRTQFLKNLAESALNTAMISTGGFSTVADAQAAIGRGEIPLNALFNVASQNSLAYFDQYKNVSGVATATGNSTPNSAFIDLLREMVIELSNVTGYISSIVPREQAGMISNYQVIHTDITGKIGLVAVNDNGGLEVCGLDGAVQDYLRNLVSETFSSMIAGYQYVWLTKDMKTAVAAIDDDGHLWLAGMTESVQTAIANGGGGGAERLIKPDGTGKIALFAREADTTPLWSYYPVSSAEKVTDNGISFIYNEGGVLKSALIPTNPLRNSSESIREIASTALKICFHAGRGQSLRVGAEGGGVASLLALRGYLLMFSGAGRDRGAGVDGEVTNDTLGALADGHIVNTRNNCQIPAAETILLNHIARSTPMPIIVTRMDARGGFSYNQLKKGTQPYIDGTAAFDAFCTRAESIGKIPVCNLIGFTHGEADANSAGLQFGTYKGYLTQWCDDTQADMISRSGQADKPWLNVDQVGSLTNTTVINGITQRGYVVAIDQWEFTKERAEAFMSIPKWLLNRQYPQNLLHLTPMGYRVLGEYQGIAEDWTIYDRVNNPTGVKFKPVQPESVVKVNETTFDITFSSPFGKPLQIKDVKGITAPNLGCDLQNGSANVVSATQQSNFVFRFVTDVAPALGDYFRFGCTATDDGANSYPLVNIFDTTTTVSRYDATFTLINPCAISRIAVI